MCGIFGSIFNINIEEAIKLCKTIKQRGPERSHYIQSKEYFLGFHRLAINGLSPIKDQPYVYVYTYTNTSDKINTYFYYVLCNGEIYNAQKLYEEIKNISDIIIYENNLNVIFSELTFNNKYYYSNGSATYFVVNTYINPSATYFNFFKYLI